MKAKNKNIFILSLLIVFLTACLGDKKSVNIEEMNDKSSFINKNFKGNLIDYNMNQSACERVSKADIAKLYDVSQDLVHIVDNVKSDQRDPNSQPNCQFFIESGESDFMWLRGNISVNREIKSNEYMGEIAEAAGNGENWEQAWALKKSISKSSEWVSGLGKAAVWKGSQKDLKIKFDGYTLFVSPLSNRLNKEEQALNRDYKKIAVEIAKAAGYIN